MYRVGGGREWGCTQQAPSSPSLRSTPSSLLPCRWVGYVSLGMVLVSVLYMQEINHPSARVDVFSVSVRQCIEEILSHIPSSPRFWITTGSSVEG